MSSGIHETGLIYSDRYAETMNQQVLPFLRKVAVPITVRGGGGKPVAAFRYDAENPRGTVVILHGFTECAEKFSELIFSLLRQDYSVLAYDQRGHGASWRDERIEDHSLTHVDYFEEYVEDLQAVCDQVLRKMPQPWYVFAHSMGGAVTSAFLEDHPGTFEKAVLCAPMIAPNRNGLPMWFSKELCRGAKRVGREHRRIPLSRPWSGPEDFATSCATGKERFDWYDALRVQTSRYQNNGPSFSWTMAALTVTERLLAPGAPEKIQIPLRLYAAEIDNSVLPEPQIQFIDRVPRGWRKLVSGSKHEIYRSPDEVLFPWWEEILVFLGA